MFIFKSKYFNELTTKELYEIIKARVEIFVIEQKILYQDLDDIDYKSLHIFIEEKNKIKAYLRAFYTSESKEIVKIGRVLTIEHGKGLGIKLLQYAIDEIKSKMKPKKIILNAQSYAIGFYEKVGFKTISDDFVEEGILHRKMEME